jgi:hypothetical protein
MDLRLKVRETEKAVARTVAWAAEKNAAERMAESAAASTKAKVKAFGSKLLSKTEAAKVVAGSPGNIEVAEPSPESTLTAIAAGAVEVPFQLSIRVSTRDGRYPVVLNLMPVLASPGADALSTKGSRRLRVIGGVSSVILPGRGGLRGTPRLQPVEASPHSAPASAAAPAGAPASTRTVHSPAEELYIGKRVSVLNLLYSKSRIAGRFYDGTIIKVQGDGSVTVEFDDGQITSHDMGSGGEIWRDAPAAQQSAV